MLMGLNSNSDNKAYLKAVKEADKGNFQPLIKFAKSKNNNI